MEDQRLPFFVFSLLYYFMYSGVLCRIFLKTLLECSQDRELECSTNLIFYVGGREDEKITWHVKKYTLRYSDSLERSVSDNKMEERNFFDRTKYPELKVDR